MKMHLQFRARTAEAGRRFILMIVLSTLWLGTAGYAMAQLPEDSAGPVQGFIYYADTTSTFLKALEHEFPGTLSTHDLAKAVIGQLFVNPGNDLKKTLPETTFVRALFILPDKTAVVDLGGIAPTMFTASVTTELLALYSIVNSLALTVPEIETVKLLVNGEEAQTLAGHIDLTYTYKANMLIVR